MLTFAMWLVMHGAASAITPTLAAPCSTSEEGEGFAIACEAGADVYFEDAPLQSVDLAPLAGRGDITRLALRLVKAKHLEIIATLASLTELDAALRQRFDLAWLPTPCRLTTLSLSTATLTSLAGLERCTELRHLALTGTNVRDLRPLAALTRLETLFLRYTNVTDLSPLAELARLTHLDVSHTPVAARASTFAAQHPAVEVVTRDASE